MSKEIIKISQEEANKIIDSREPLGMFYQEDGDLFIGIDNTNGDAFVEEFKCKNTCFRWLRGELELS